MKMKEHDIYYYKNQSICKDCSRIVLGVGKSKIDGKHYIMCYKNNKEFLIDHIIVTCLSYTKREDNNE